MDSNVAELIGVELIETRLLNSHSIKYAVTCVAPKAPAIAKRQGSPRAGHDASAKVAVGFRADAEVERNTRMGEIAEVEKAGLIVAADVGLREIRDGAVFGLHIGSRRWPQNPGGYRLSGLRNPRGCSCRGRRRCNYQNCVVATASGLV